MEFVPIAQVEKFASYSARIIVARWRGKTAGMLAAFQGFAAPHGGKKTGEEWQLFMHTSIGSPYKGKTTHPIQRLQTSAG